MIEQGRAGRAQADEQDIDRGRRQPACGDQRQAETRDDAKPGCDPVDNAIGRVDARDPAYFRGCGQNQPGEILHDALLLTNGR